MHTLCHQQLPCCHTVWHRATARAFGNGVPRLPRPTPLGGIVRCKASTDDGQQGGEAPGEQDSIIKRLDFLLGEVSGQQAAQQTQSVATSGSGGATSTSLAADKALQMAGIFRMGNKIELVKVPPVWSFIFYYWNIVIYVAAMYLDANEGPGAGIDFCDQLVNDHLAVTVAGEAYRLLSCPFVHVSPWSMFVTILALGTIGAELEGQLGYWPFFGFCALVATSSSLLEVLVDTDPVTHGSLPLLAGLVGGLLVAYAKDTLLQQEVQAVTAAAAPGLSSKDYGDGRVADRSRGSLDDEGEEEEVEVEFFEGIYKMNVQTTPLLKALATISTGALAAVEALWDLQQDNDIDTTWAGVLGGLAAGVLLALLLLPRSTLSRVPMHVALSATPVSAFMGKKPSLLPAQLAQDVYWLQDQVTNQQRLAVVAAGAGVCALVLAQVSTAL